MRSSNIFTVFRFSPYVYCQYHYTVCPRLYFCKLIDIQYIIQIIKIIFLLYWGLQVQCSSLFKLQIIVLYINIYIIKILSVSKLFTDAIAVQFNGFRHTQVTQSYKFTKTLSIFLRSHCTTYIIIL